MSDTDITWGSWLALVVAGFGYLEAREYRRNGLPGTLSATLRRWLGVSPQRRGRRLLGAVFVSLLAWFAGHILDE